MGDAQFVQFMRDLHPGLYALLLMQFETIHSEPASHVFTTEDGGAAWITEDESAVYVGGEKGQEG